MMISSIKLNNRTTITFMPEYFLQEIDFMSAPIINQ